MVGAPPLHLIWIKGDSWHVRHDGDEMPREHRLLLGCEELFRIGRLHLVNACVDIFDRVKLLEESLRCYLANAWTAGHIVRAIAHKSQVVNHL